MSSQLPPNPYINPLFPFIFISAFTLPISEIPFSSQICSPSSPIMGKTRGVHSYWSRVRRSSTTPADTSTPGVVVVVGPKAPAARPSATVIAYPTPTAVQGPTAADAKGSSSMAPGQRRYHTRVDPTLPAPSHHRPARRAPPPKRARTSSPGESSTSRPREPPSPPYQGIVGATNLSPASIIRQPYFPCSPIQGNVDCGGRDFHGEVYYNVPTFAEDL